jgi:hypothetical protein
MPRRAIRGGDPTPTQRPPAARVVVALVQVELVGRRRGRPGRPWEPLTAGTASTSRSSSSESWVLAADRPTASGMPRRSTSRWYLDPGLPRSVGFGPVRQPPLGAHADRVQTGAGPVQLAVAVELLKQQVVELLPDADALPVPQPPPASDRAAAAKLADRQQPPRDAGAELVDDAGQAGAVVDAGLAAVAAWWRGQQWLDGPPQLLWDQVIDDGGHGRRIMPTTQPSNNNRPKVGTRSKCFGS